jgi:hypothetical protein
MSDAGNQLRVVSPPVDEEKIFACWAKAVLTQECVATKLIVL